MLPNIQFGQITGRPKTIDTRNPNYDKALHNVLINEGLLALRPTRHFQGVVQTQYTSPDREEYRSPVTLPYDAYVFQGSLSHKEGRPEIVFYLGDESRFPDNDVAQKVKGDIRWRMMSEASVSPTSLAPEGMHVSHSGGHAFSLGAVESQLLADSQQMFKDTFEGKRSVPQRTYNLS